METSAVVSALIGAAVGSLGAQVLSFWLTGRQVKKDDSQLLIRNYLVQLQDSLESLWHRVENLAFRGGKAVVDDPDYYRLSSLYILASFLARKRGLVVEGVYGHLEGLSEGSGARLETGLEAIERSIGRQRNDRGGIPRYHRQELADMAMEWSDGGWRLKNYSEFKTSLTTSQADSRPVAAASSLFLHLDRKVAHEILAAVESVGEIVSEWTHVAMSYEGRRRSESHQPGPNEKRSNG